MSKSKQTVPGRRPSIDIGAISHGLALRADGIWHSRTRSEVSYPAHGNDDCFQLEDRSFWFRHRNACIISAVNAHPPPANGAIFDIGGGNGFVAAGLIRAGYEAVVVEPGLAGAANAKRRGLEHVICATTEGSQFAPESIPAAGIFDVLEHVRDDTLFLQDIKALLAPRGCLYLTVPSYNGLWSSEDESAGHFRRYTVRGLRRILEHCGYQIEFSSYFFRWLPLPVLALRALPYRLGLTYPGKQTLSTTSAHGVKNDIATKLLARLLESELRIIDRQKSLGFGGSCLLVARKPGQR